jgi:hypothetical protein
MSDPTDPGSWSSNPQPPSDSPGPPQYGQPQYGSPGKTESTAIASLVLGIVGLVGCIFVAPILAIVFSNQAKNKIRQNPSLQGQGMATAGFVLGIVGLVFDVGYLLIILNR